MNANVYYIDVENFIDKFMPGFIQSMDFEVNSSGDLKTGDTLEQEIFFILKAQPGNYYYYPRVGFGIDTRLNDNISKVEVKKEIRSQLENDNLTVDEINILTLQDLDSVTDAQVRAILLEQRVLFNIKARRK